MKGLLISFASCLMLTEAHYQDSDKIALESNKNHDEIFRDGELTRVLSSLLGQSVPVQPKVTTADRSFSINAGVGLNQQQNQQYGPPPQQVLQQNKQYGPQQQQQKYGPPPPGTQQPSFNREYSFSTQFTLPFGERTRPRQGYNIPPPPSQQQQQQQQQQQFTPILQTNNFNQVNSGYSQSQAPQRQPDLTQKTYPSPLTQNPEDQLQVSFPEGQDSSIGQRFVYVYTPPNEQEEPQRTRVISPPQKQDTNYQIIFVKAPGSAPPQPVEIQMPPPTEQKTLVYVLVKKPQPSDQEIRFSSPPPTSPTPPEVFFIKYRRNPNLPLTSDPNSVQGQSANDIGQTSQSIGDRNVLPSARFSSLSSNHESSSGPSSSQYSAPRSTSWDTSPTRIEGGRVGGFTNNIMRLTTSNYIAPQTSDPLPGGY